MLKDRNYLAVLAPTVLFSFFPYTLKSESHEIKSLKEKIVTIKKRLDHMENTISALPEKVEQIDRPMVHSGTKKLSLELSGQMNRSVQMISNGATTRTQHVDNEADPSRVAMLAKGKLSDDFSVGAAWEVAVQSNNTVAAQSGSNIFDADSGNFVYTRRAEIMLEDKRLGRLSLGRGKPAGYNIGGECDLSGTDAVAQSAEFRDMAARAFFVDAPTGLTSVGPSPNGIRIYNVADGMKGIFGLDNRARYDTPELFRFLTFSASHTGRANDIFNFSALARHDFRGVEIKAGAAYTQAHLHYSDSAAVNQVYNQYLGTFGVLFPSGFNFHSLVGKRVFPRLSTARNGNIWVLKVGYRFSYFKVGDTALSIDYGRFSNMQIAFKTDGTHYDLKGVGIFAVQTLRDVCTDIYVGVRRYTLDAGLVRRGNVRQPADYKPIIAVLAGARTRF